MGVGDEDGDGLRAQVARLRAQNAEQASQIARLRTLSDRSVDSVLLHDGKGRIFDANEHAWRSLGYTRAQLLELNIRDLDVGLQKIPFERYGQNWAKMPVGKIFHDESQHIRADGSLVPVEIRVSAFEHDGQRRFVATCRDISQRLAAEEAQAHSDRRFRAVFEDSPLAMMMVARDGRFTQVNPAATKMFGYAAGELTERTISALTHPDDQHVGRAELAELWEGTREYMRVDKRYLTNSGREIWVTVSAFRDYDADGATTQTIAFLEDITEKRAAEQARQSMLAQLEVLVTERTGELQATNSRLRDEITERLRTEEQLSEAKLAAEEASRAKSRFLASMSHELRTPLNAVIGYAEMLQEDAVDSGVEDMVPDLEKIRGAGKHLLGIINDILDLSKVEAGKMELSFEELPLGPVIEDVVSTIKPLASKNGNALDVELAADLGTVHTDVTRLRQILFNLLSNACKFTEKGRIRMGVRREPGGDGDRIHFTIEDTGIGIEPAQLQRLFQPFTQADASTTRKYGGTGLGLSISHRFCTMLGGSLSAHSRPGEGTTFEVELPAETPQRSSHTSFTVGSPEAPLVLVIDDDAAARDLITRMLTEEGYRVAVAPSGQEGLSAARELSPAVITLDVIMPTMDGWAVLSALKADEALRDIPVVLVTMVQDRQMGFSLGASEFLSKPLHREALLRVIDRFRCAHPPCSALVVDDDPEARHMIKRALSKDGWHVVEAENGRVAMERVHDLDPGVILLDLVMPEKDGFAVLRELQTDPRTAAIPVIVITAADLTHADREMLDKRVAHVMNKGRRDRDSLLEDVRKHVSACVDRTLTRGR